MCGLFLIFAADSLGRRKSLLWTSIAMGLSMLYVGLFVRIAPPQPNTPVSPAGYVALVCIYLFASFFQWARASWMVMPQLVGPPGSEGWLG